MISPNEILLLNPRKKRKRRKTTVKRKTASKPGSKRTTRKRTRKNPTRRTIRRSVLTKGKKAMPRKRRSTKKRAVRRNPSRRTRAVARRARGALTGLNFRTALKNIPLGALGMFVTKWAAKRGTPDALESDPATWDAMTYVKGGLGAVAGGYAMNMVKPGTGQKFLEGGLMLLLYKALQNHVVPQSQFLTGQFGATGTYQPGDVEVNSEGEPFILGQDGQQWLPLNEGGYQELSYGDVLEEPGRLGFGDVLEEPGRLGSGYGQPGTESAYARSLFDR